MRIIETIGLNRSETKESTGDQTKRAGRKSAMSNSNCCCVDHVEAGEENINK